MKSLTGTSFVQHLHAPINQAEQTFWVSAACKTRETQQRPMTCVLCTCLLAVQEHTIQRKRTYTRIKACMQEATDALGCTDTQAGSAACRQKPGDDSPGETGHCR